MLNYDEFKEVVMAKFADYFTDSLKTKGCFERVEINKLNKTREAIAIREGRISFFAYMDALYQDYQISGDMEEVLSTTAKMVKKQLERVDGIISCFKQENFTKQIRCRIINTKINRKLLEKVVHREFNDLSVIYQWRVEDEDGTYSMIIRNDMAEKIGISEEQMFQMALQNTRRMYPMYTENMTSMLLRIFQDKESPEEILETGKNMYVISNEMHRNGAVCLLYEEYFRELAEKLDSDLYILPSSIHEVIAVPTKLDEVDPAILVDMVKSINDKKVAPEDRLSNSIYLYSRKDGKISILAEA